MEILKKLFERHKDWCDIVESFGCNPETAEDIVQSMYEKIGRLVAQGKDITFGNDVNHFYIFRTLTTIFLDYKRRERKEGDFDFDNYDIEDEQEVEYKKKYEIILEELDNMYWYDKKVYEIIESGESISELSRKTNISYYSLYNTYKKVKKYLKDKI
jgi:DNA-directed RNA polymerase specialized sigma24 family protein